MGDRIGWGHHLQVASDLTDRLAAAAYDPAFDCDLTEVELVHIAEAGTTYQRELACILLGRVGGPDARSQLRRVFAKAGEPALVRASALGGLVDLLGAKATPQMVIALQDRSPWLSQVGAAGLAAVGDERGWEPALDKVGRLLRTKRRSSQPSVVLPLVCYLAKHLNPDRRARLIALVHRRWANLADPEQWWFVEHWPAALPNRPQATADGDPTVDVLDRWLAETAGQSPRF